ncbi:hypothetical protein H4R35_005661, partial [Dimargaris xerosporica]
MPRKRRYHQLVSAATTKHSLRRSPRLQAKRQALEPTRAGLGSPSSMVPQAVTPHHTAPTAVDAPRPVPNASPPALTIVMPPSPQLVPSDPVGDSPSTLELPARSLIYSTPPEHCSPLSSLSSCSNVSISPSDISPDQPLASQFVGSPRTARDVPSSSPPQPAAAALSVWDALAALKEVRSYYEEQQLVAPRYSLRSSRASSLVEVRWEFGADISPRS